MKKTSLALLGVLIFAISIAATAVYAYFTALTNPFGVNVGSGSDPAIVDVASSYELAIAASGRFDQASGDASQIVDRVNLRLTSSVVLDRDIVFGADASLDLNGFTLDFNAHTLTVAHTYRTSVKFVNGTFEDSAANADRAPRIRADGGCTVKTDAVVPGPIAQAFGYTDVRDFVSVQTLTAAELGNAADAYVAARLYPYYVGDIVLPTRLGRYDIRFDWRALPDVDGLVDDNGNLDRTLYANLVADTAVELELTLSGVASGTYRYRTLVTPKSGILARAAEDFETALRPYAHAGESGDRYLAGDKIALPVRNVYLGVTYSLSAVLTDADGVSTALTPGKDGTISVPKSGDLNVSADVAENGVSIGTLSYAVRAVVESPAAIAAEIVDLYGAYVFRKVGDENPLLDAEKLFQMGVVGVEYSFINNEFATEQDPDTTLLYYEIDAATNVIRMLATYETTLNVYLRVRLSFASASMPIAKDVRLICLIDSSGSGETPGEDTEADLYAFACAQLDAALRSDSYANFTVLNKFRGYTIAYFPGDADAESVDPLGGRILAQSVGDGRVEFSYRISEIPRTDTSVYFRFRFGENPDYYEKTYSYTLKGILQPGDFPDLTLRDAVYAAYDANGDGILATEEAAARKDRFEFSASCSSFAGLGNLTGTREFDLGAAQDAVTLAADLLASLPANVSVLRATGRNIADASGIARLTELTELDLSANALSMFGAYGNPKLTILNLAANALTACPDFASFSKLETLDLSENAIEKFDSLIDCLALKTAMVYGNISADATLGSLGIANDYTFLLLTRRGVAVYREDGIRFMPNAAQTKGALILQGIMLDLGGGATQLPLKLFTSASEYYSVEWFENAVADGNQIKGAAGADTVAFTPNVSTKSLIVRITVTLTTDGVESQATVTRAFAL